MLKATIFKVLAWLSIE